VDDIAVEKDDTLTCKICQIKCSSAENLQDHLQGKSHKYGNLDRIDFYTKQKG
jgi:hypothetical protein